MTARPLTWTKTSSGNRIAITDGRDGQARAYLAGQLGRGWFLETWATASPEHAATTYGHKTLAAAQRAANEAEGVTLVDEIKAYAAEHYDAGGWDVVVECWEDAQIADAIEGCTTLAQVLRKSTLAACVDVWADRQADAVNSAF